MINEKIAFIGAGNMGGALIEGLLKSGVEAAQIYVYDTDSRKTAALTQKGITVAATALNAVIAAKYIVLAVKPQYYGKLLEDIGYVNDKVFISIAPGISLFSLSQQVSGYSTCVRVMPNTPAAIGQGMSVIADSGLPADVMTTVRAIFETAGEVEVVPERLMDAVVAMSGSSPAYVYLLIDAMADAGVSAGLSKELALRLAAQAVKGSAAMVQQTGEHPAVLKDRVCSPGGTTIKAVETLEKAGFRSSIYDAVNACITRCRELS